MSRAGFSRGVLVLVWGVGLPFGARRIPLKLLPPTAFRSQSEICSPLWGICCLLCEHVVLLQPLLGCCDEHLRHLFIQPQARKLVELNVYRDLSEARIWGSRLEPGCTPTELCPGLGKKSDAFDLGWPGPA